MTVPEAIELFQNEILNEFSHLPIEDQFQDDLVRTVKSVAETVHATYEAECKQQ